MPNEIRDPHKRAEAIKWGVYTLDQLLILIDELARDSKNGDYSPFIKFATYSKQIKDAGGQPGFS